MRAEPTSFRSVFASPTPRVTVWLGILDRGPTHPTELHPGWRQQRRAEQHAAGQRLRTAAIDDLGGIPGATTSISHSGHWIVAGAGCGLSAIGVDVEQSRPRQAARLSSHLGWRELDAGREPDRLGEDFAQLWTLWEAAVKCDGTSVLERTTAAFTALRSGWSAGQDGSWGNGRYHACATRLADGAWVTVVTQSTRPPVFVWRTLPSLG